MNEKVSHLCGLAVKYLIHVNAILGDKQIKRYIKKLQKINQKLLVHKELTDISELQYDLRCGLKQLYKMMRQAGLINEQNNSISDLLVDYNQVYFSSNGHRCCVIKTAFYERDRQKILLLIKNVNKKHIYIGGSKMITMKEITERHGEYAKSLEYLYDYVFPLDEVYKMFEQCVPFGESKEQWINRLINKLPSKYVKDGGVTGRGLGELRALV